MVARFFLFWGLCVSLKIFCALAADQVFLSIDCGAVAAYTDPLGIHWESDSPYIKSGRLATVGGGSNSSDLPRPFTTLRYFPYPKKNCYPLPLLVQGSKYLIRASFYYGNYDGKASPPSFALQFDGNVWWEDVVTYMDKPSLYEVTYSVKVRNASVCVAQKLDGQIPFISSLEIRSTGANTYTVDSNEDVLFTYVRTAFGSPDIVRFPDYPYDRIWYPNAPIAGLVSVASESEVMNCDVAADIPAAKALLHAVTPSSPNATSMTIPCPVQSSTALNIYYNMYYAEVTKSVAANKNRSFELTIDGGKVSKIPIVPPFERVVETGVGSVALSSGSVLRWVIDPGSTVPPLINALEFFVNRHGLASGTVPADVEGLKLLQDSYQLQLQSWSGDPCLPVGFTWEWLNCNVSADQARVIALFLSGYGLNGTLPDFGILQALQKNDLSNNSLSGVIPDFLGRFPNLIDLNLAFNNFTGEVPYSLRNKKGLNLNTTGNAELANGTTNGTTDPSRPSLGSPPSNDPKKKYLIIGLSAGSAALLLLLILGVLLYLYGYNPRERGPLQSQTDRAFSYQEIVDITNNFSLSIGTGGSDTVYYGRLKDKKETTEVAVKVLSESNREFVAEVKLLMKIHHKHLVSFFGFCEEDNRMVVLYEYMANGNLGDLLHGNKPLVQALTWKKRIEIARDIATGLQYLHSGCEPSIIHRDVKSRNVLLNEQLDAKLADFGICTTGFTLHEVGYVSTNAVGTPGYIDPEYSQTNMLTEKSDVYSFGVVLFELLSGQPAILGPQENRVHIVTWARITLEEKEIGSIVDPRLKEPIETDSLSKVAGLAMGCTEHKSSERPTMDDVLNQLKEALQAHHDTQDPAPPSRVVMLWPNGGENSGSDAQYTAYPRAR